MKWVRDPRSWGLMLCAGICMTRFVAYLPGRNEMLPIGLAQVAHVLPVWVYGLLWLVTGVALVVIAMQQWPIRWWHSVMVAVPTLWGSLWFIGGLTGGGKSSITSGFLFWVLAGIFVCFELIPPRAVTGVAV